MLLMILLSNNGFVDLNAWSVPTKYVTKANAAIYVLNALNLKAVSLVEVLLIKAKLMKKRN